MPQMREKNKNLIRGLPRLGGFGGREPFHNFSHDGRTSEALDTTLRESIPT